MDQVAKQKFNLWHKLGFGEPFPPGFEMEGFAEGGHIITTQTHFSIRDRLRVFVSGKIMTRTVLKTEQPLIGKTIAASRACVLPPGTKPPAGARVNP